MKSASHDGGAMNTPFLPAHRPGDKRGLQGIAYTFTVFTPTYNRADTLERAYESLRLQTYRDFEWLVVDDGSTDRTQQLLTRWRAEATFPIRCIYQENQGKHVAYNRAVAEARGAFLMPLDSDDACVPQTLARLKYHWDNIQEHLREGFVAVTALCVDDTGRLVGTRFPQDVWDSDSLSATYKYKVSGDKCGFQRTAVLREFPMPGPEVGKSAIPEGLVWFRIARKYKTRFVNEALLINFRSEDSLSRPRYPQTNAVGAELYNRTQLNDNIDYLADAPLEFLKSAANFARFSFHLRRSPANQYHALTNWRAKALWLLALPIGATAYALDPVPVPHR